MKTRKILKGVLFITGIIMLTAACNKKDDGPTLDFNITVPSDWSYYIYANEGYVYHAVSPRKNDNDSISEDLTVMKYSVDNSTLQNFYTDYVTALAKDTSYHQISVKDTTINGEEAIKLTHLQLVVSINSARKDTLVLDAQMQKYIMMNKSYGYVFSFNALRETFKEYHPLFDDIIATFTFKD